MLRLSPYGGGGVSSFESLLLLFSLCGELFCGFFFSKIESLSATFFRCRGLFAMLFSFCGAFSRLKAFLLYYFSLYEESFLPCGGAVFVFMGTLFWLAPPTKIMVGAHDCVSHNPYE